jgi:4-hydroxybenzoate polyprenyltransferase
MTTLKKRLPAFLRLMRFDKPIGTLLLLWPTLWALLLAADGMPDWDILVIFVLGVVFMRAAGCVINDYADRHIDGYVQRTKLRPIPAGLISPKEALISFAALCALSLILVLMTNTLTVKLSFIGLALASLYPFMKRYTHMPQVILGAAFAWSIPMAFAAQTGEVPTTTWALYIGVVMWTVAYDTFYAMVDREDDLKIGVKSTAILFGDMDIQMTSTLQILTIIALIMTGVNFDRGGYYYAGIVVAGLLFIYQQSLIRNRDKELCFKAFLNNNLVGAAVFAGLFFDYALD